MSASGTASGDGLAEPPDADSEPGGTPADGGRPVAFTVGHSTRSAEEFVDLLAGAGVDLLVDVRRHPGSRRHPHFNRGELAETLEAHGIDYRHEERLGGRRDPADGESPNRGWESPGFRAYADHLLSEEGRRALDELEAEAREVRLAVMCAEAVPWKCHRQIVADHLVARGIEVRHLMDEGRAERHGLREMAEVADGRLVVYPGPGSEQPELFE